MREDVKNMNSNQLVKVLTDEISVIRQFHNIEEHPYFGDIKRELEHRLSSWTRETPRKLIVKSK